MHRPGPSAAITDGVIGVSPLLQPLLRRVTPPYRLSSCPPRFAIDELCWELLNAMDPTPGGLTQATKHQRNETKR